MQPYIVRPEVVRRLVELLHSERFSVKQVGTVA